MEYTGNDPKHCKITVKNVKDEYNCQWAARLDEDLSNTIVNITVAREITNVTIENDGDLEVRFPLESLEGAAIRFCPLCLE